MKKEGKNKRRKYKRNIQRDTEKKKKEEKGDIFRADGSLQYVYFRNHNRMYDYAMISLLGP